MSSQKSYHQVSVKEEFRKNPDLKREDLKQLREWTSGQIHLPAITDEMLIIFHHRCFYDLENTKTCIQKYYSMRQISPEFFTNRDVTSPELHIAAQVLGFAVLPLPDIDGNYIFYMRIRDFETSKFVYADQIKLIYMTLDALTLRQGTVPGFVLVKDMNGITIPHILKHGWTTMMKNNDYMQEANPIRLKRIHVTNVFWWIPKAMEFILPWINKAASDTLHYHKSNSTLYDYVPRGCLPKEAGGDLESMDHYHAENLKILESLRDYFLDEETTRHDANKPGEAEEEE